MRTKRALLNMSTSLIYQVVAIICGLITPRLILATFGSTYNGVVTSATQFLSMIQILTLGITGATRLSLYRTLAAHDTLGTSRIMKATNRYMRKVACAVILYAGVLCLIYPMISHSELSSIESASIIAIVSIGTFAEYFFGISNHNLLQADQASYVSNLLNISKVILNTICVAILIKAGCSIYTVKLGSSLVFLLIPIIMSIYVQKKYHLIRKCEPDTQCLRQRKAVAFHSIANMVHANTDIVVLTIFTTAKEVSVYTVYYLVIGKIKTLMQVFTSGMEAAFGDMWVKKEYDTLKKSFSAFEFLLFSFTAIVFSCVWTLIIPFVSLYTRNVTDVNYIRPTFAFLVIIAEAMYCVRHPYLTLVYSTGSFEETKFGAAIEALLNITISAVLINFLGINGVIIGTLCANLFRTIQFALFTSKNILNRNFSHIVKRFIWLLGTAFCSIFVIQMSFSYMPFPEGGAGWILKGVVATATSSIFTVLSSLMFYRSDLFYLVSKVKGLIHRKVKV